jgi:hypothetical protein
MQPTGVGQAAGHEVSQPTPVSPVRLALDASVAVARRYADVMAVDVARVRRLPSLLARAGAVHRWSAEERREAESAARSLMRVGLWCVVLAMPGGFLLLPLVCGEMRRR